jgi:FAD/FMN-containing dehydrogenase
MVNRATAGAFNSVYHWRQGEGTRTLDCRAFFHPLDGVSGWNRLYGPRGFYQHQAQVPEGEAGRAAIAAMLARVARSGHGSFLGVLKRFGSMAPMGMLSFPRPGCTLALDFPNRGADTLALLASLDDIVREAGGRVYPAKDARMSAAMFEASFPEWRAFAAHVDPAFSSSFWRRVTGPGAAA